MPQFAGPTPLIDLVLKAQQYYSGSDVTAVFVSDPDADFEPGPIRKCDVSRIYKFENTLYEFRMNGRQLKNLMEISAKYYHTWHAGDPEVTTDPKSLSFTYLIFRGVDYDIDLARDIGYRIRNLKWPDGRLVDDDDVFTLSINDYWGRMRLLNPASDFGPDLPELLAKDLRPDIGMVRDMITEYIVNVKNGLITPECDKNWRLTAGSIPLEEAVTKPAKPV